MQTHFVRCVYASTFCEVCVCVQAHLLCVCKLVGNRHGIFPPIGGFPPI